jgi:hypothetical protein
MTTYSNLLRLALQDTGENDSTWGDVANNGVFRLLEAAVAGMATISLNAGNVTLTSANGASDQSRSAILRLTGILASARTVTIPALTKIYLVINETTGAQDVTIEPTGGTGVVVPNGAAVWVYCDGTDAAMARVGSAATADLATLATTATDALSLGGVLAANWARLNQAQTFSGAQRVSRVALSAAAGLVDVNAALSNCFSLSMAGNYTLLNPTNPVDGQTIRIVLKQDGVGGRTLGYGTKYKFPGGVAPVLSTAAAAVDYLVFEYYSADDIWFGNIAKAFS